MKAYSRAMNDPNVEKYLDGFLGETRQYLDTMRQIIKAEAPGAVESFSYGLVGYKMNGKPLVYFGGYAKHIGFYATPNGHEAFKDEFVKYKEGKGSVQFPLDQPLPAELIKKVIEYRLEQVSKGEK